MGHRLKTKCLQLYVFMKSKMCLFCSINIMGEDVFAWKCKGFSYSLHQRRVKKSTEQSVVKAAALMFFP